jgi:uncharacterized protein
VALRRRPAVLLFPGAGSGRDHAQLLASEAALLERKAAASVVRADFPYRKAGRRAPDRQPVLLEAVRSEALALGKGPVVLGGRSMGGRMCSIAVADGLVPNAVGLVCIAYPLHPPGRPEKLRTEHLPRITVPCLFVSGTKDTFFTPEELLAASALIPAPVEHVWIEGGRHELKGAEVAVAAAVAAFVAGCSARIPGSPASHGGGSAT